MSELFCERLPDCGRDHHPDACERVHANRIAYASVVESGDWHEGMDVVWQAMMLLHFIVNCDDSERCTRCGVLGPKCVPFETVETDADGRVSRTIHYCSID